MSWQATLWAASLPHARVGHVSFRVLMLLADHAHEDGTGSWRSVSSMASTLEVSERTIHRAIRDLKIERLIVPGDQRMLNHLPAHRRPIVYNLCIQTPIARQEELSTGVTNLSGVTTAVGSYEEEPPLTTNSSSIANHTVRVTPSGRPTCPQGHELIDDRHCIFGCPILEDAHA